MPAQETPRIGYMLGPHFVRMAGSFGYMKGCFTDYSHGRIPRPHSITGVSSGGIIGAAVCPFNQKAFQDGEKRLVSLKGSQFYNHNKDLMLWGGIEAFSPLAIFLPWEMIKSRLWRNAAKGAVVAGMELAEEQFIEHLFSANGVFSNRRLHKLLMEFLDFKSIFNSDIKLDVVSANLNGDIEKNLNVAPHVVTNYRPEHKNNDELLADGIVKSTSIPGFFPTSQNDAGEFITDGGIYGAYPIEIPYNHGCDVIVVVELNYAGQRYLRHDYAKWISAIHRALDITVDNQSALVISGCRNMNNDLEQIKKMETIIANLGTIAMDLPKAQKQAIFKQINIFRQEISRLTAYGKKFFNLVFVKSRREIVEFNFREKHLESYMRQSIEIGEEAYFNSRDELQKAIERVSKNR